MPMLQDVTPAGLVSTSALVRFVRICWDCDSACFLGFHKARVLNWKASVFPQSKFPSCLTSPMQRRERRQPMPSQCVSLQDVDAKECITRPPGVAAVVETSC